MGYWGVVMQDPVCELPRTPIPRTRVNKGMKKGRDRQKSRLIQLALDLSLCASPSPPCIRQPHRL
jgi:hypothetical protein